MGILERVFSITKAAANEMLDKIENPVMMLNHYLRDLDEDIAKAERSLVTQQAQVRMLQSKLDEQNGQAAYYEDKAVQAASADREAEARTALEAKLLYKEHADESSRLLEFAQQAVTEIELRLEALKEERTRLQGKRTELIARVQQAGVVSGAPAPQSFEGSSAARGFDRIEQKVMEWEAARELSKAPYGSYSGSASSVPNPQQEKRNALVEEELQRLLNK
ncbi:PspA/IM30 family protein [Paenibacillus radicis (ex Gao et al. 2016)]|uniref:Protein LiaH n=1 Tax=Paenibacillus radicis (ex Gao et al. 2016) TaxID=1737354 RepID=A0A917M714_9BACL|nr:PspA/IM30 family protein [Paenibacillus radicis (ex Gao et al. 2016)]GGG81444.1 protein LiaH [Paenibacillus radicis (ex Gao et al. 2016)]